MTRVIEISAHKRTKPERPLAFYRMLEQLEGAASEDTLARELDRELSGITREELERMKETY